MSKGIIIVKTVTPIILMGIVSILLIISKCKSDTYYNKECFFVEKEDGSFANIGDAGKHNQIDKTTGETIFRDKCYKHNEGDNNGYKSNTNSK